MSKGGHALVTAAIGGAIALGAHHLVLGVATTLAAQVPDRAELVLGFGPNGQRWSVIPHRTLSHSPYPYLVLLVIGLLLPPVATPIGVVALGNVVAGVGAGALIHLALDVLSPSGVPLLNPFGRRTSLGPNLSGGHPYLYRTSTAEEWPILLPFAILLAVDVGAIALNVALNGLPDPRLLLGWLRA